MFSSSLRFEIFSELNRFQILNEKKILLFFSKVWIIISMVSPRIVSIQSHVGGVLLHGWVVMRMEAVVVWIVGRRRIIKCFLLRVMRLWRRWLLIVVVVSVGLISLLCSPAIESIVVRPTAAVHRVRKTLQTKRNKCE